MFYNIVSELWQFIVTQSTNSYVYKHIARQYTILAYLEHFQISQNQISWLLENLYIYISLRILLHICNQRIQADERFIHVIIQPFII